MSASCLCSLVVNVMQRDSIPSEVDYETRQGVYSICLQLARYPNLLLNGIVLYVLSVKLACRVQRCVPVSPSAR